MGVSFIDGEVVGPSGKETVRFLIDSGATYSLLFNPFNRTLQPMKMLLA